MTRLVEGRAFRLGISCTLLLASFSLCTFGSWFRKLQISSLPEGIYLAILYEMLCPDVLLFLVIGNEIRILTPLVLWAIKATVLWTVRADKALVFQRVILLVLMCVQWIAFMVL